MLLFRSNGKDFETRVFSGFTSSLLTIRNWLKEEQVSHVTMESIGSSMKIINDIIDGIEDLSRLVSHTHGKIKASKEGSEARI